MLYSICLLFILFISYSVMGWIIECITCSIEQKKLVYDRGFLLGPYCPIYGWGGLCAYLILTKYENDLITLFILAAVGASVLEYVTSYLMEKLFKARWWDYSHRKFNIEGRVCLANSILFGLLAVIFVYIINPLYLEIIRKIPSIILIVISIILFVLFLIDNIISFIVMTKLKINISTIKKDSTTEIDKQVKEFIKNYRFFIKRLFKAFPKIKFSFSPGEEIKEIIQEIINNIDIQKKRK